MPYPLEQDKSNDYKWWEKDEGPAMAACVQSAYRYIYNHDETRRACLLRDLQLYGNLDLFGIGLTGYFRTAAANRMTLNVIKSVVDTVVSKVAKSRVRPTFLTSGGNWALQRKARLLEKWVDAQFYETKVYRKAPAAFRDAAIFGDGFLKIYRIGKKIHVERIWPGEIYADPGEALYGEPPTLYQVKYVDREALTNEFPDKKGVIKTAGTPTEEEDEKAYFIGKDSLADQVQVVESWRLGSSEEGGGGRHVISVDRDVLVEEAWDHDYFPFVQIHWSDRVRGFWGMGLSEELMAIQVEINRMLQRIQKAFHLLAVPRVFLDHSSKVLQTHINNDVGAIVRYHGNPPTIMSPQTINPEYFAHLDRLYNRAFEIAGVSQASAQSQKPAGLDSGIALREYQDIQSERFSASSKDWEEFHMDIARHMVDLGKEISEEFPDYRAVTSRDKYTIADVPWEEVDLERDSFVLKVFPTSSLPSTPAGRLAAVTDMLTAQLISPERAKILLDFPDLEDEMALDRAATDSIMRQIEQMLDKGEFQPPEPFQDPVLNLKYVQAAYLDAQNNGCPEDRLQLLRQHINLTLQMMQAAAAATQAQQAPPPGTPPPGGEGAPPQAAP